MDTKSFVNIDYVISSYLNRKNIGSTSDWDRYKQILIEHVTDLNIFHTRFFKTEIGQVNEINQYNLPADFIDWVSVAVELNGEFWELDVNNNLITEPDNTAETPVFQSHLLPPKIKGYRYTRRRRNAAGGFKVDYNQRLIVFEGNFKGKDVYLNYTSSGVPGQGDVFIPRELITVLRDYLDWIIKENDPTVTITITQRAEIAYGRSLLQYYDHKQDISGKELLNLFRNSLQQGVKR